MMILDLINKRFSARDYQKKTIPKETLLQVLEAGRLAPSAVNYQPWHFVVIQSPEMLQQIQSTYARPWINTAPAIIVICGDHNAAWHRPLDGKDHCDIDIAIAIDHMTLEATELGLGTCWVCMFDAPKCSQILKLPDHIEPIALLPIGYPTDSGPTERHHKRKDLREIVHWDTFSAHEGS